MKKDKVFTWSDEEEVAPEPPKSAAKQRRRVPRLSTGNRFSGGSDTLVRHSSVAPSTPEYKAIINVSTGRPVDSPVDSEGSGYWDIEEEGGDSDTPKKRLSLAYAADNESEEGRPIE